jgi:hypothetical protein
MFNCIMASIVSHAIINTNVAENGKANGAEKLASKMSFAEYS